MLFHEINEKADFLMYFYKINTQEAILLFIKEEDLYNVVKKESKIELLPYSNNVSLASIIHNIINI